MANFFDSDSDSESTFSGFGESDIEAPLIHDDDDDDELSSDDDEPAENDRWTRNFSNIRVDEFQEQPGPNLPPGFDTETARPIDYFWLMFPLELIGLITRHTNSYAHWKMIEVGKDDERWYDVTDQEMRAFLGINVMMGISQLPDIEMYWSTDPFTRNEGIANTMTCNRFQKILQYFHVSDRTTEPARGQPGYDKLYKVREFMTAISSAFLRGYTLSREASVDEAMIKYSGRLSFRQYMPAKPIKRGIKVWMLCDANTAYLSRFEVYLGRQNNTTEHGLGHNVVTRLTDHIQHSRRWLFFDNFFTGLPLVQSLLANGLYSCGTVRMNRQGFPKELKNPKDIQNRGDMKVLQLGKSNVTASVWKDKKKVHHLSTLSQPGDVRDAQRRFGAQVLHLQQPHSVYAYNRFMGGVDLHDQFRMKYSVGRTSRKWWRYLFWFMLNCAIVNAHIIYKQVSSRRTKQKRYQHKDFRLELVREIIGGFCKRKRAAGDNRNMEVLLDAENIAGHIHTRLPGKPTTCKYHSKVLRQRKETVYGCAVCNVHLCKNGCHGRYHGLEN